MKNNQNLVSFSPEKGVYLYFADSKMTDIIDIDVEPGIRSIVLSGPNANEVSTPMRCITPIEVVSKTEQSSEKHLQELAIKGFVLEAVPLSSLEHKTNEPYADRANKGLFTKPPIHWQMMPKEYFGLCFAFEARA